MRWAIAGGYSISLSRVLSVDRGLAWLRGTALDLDWWSASGWMDRTKDGWITWLRARAAEVLHPFHQNVGAQEGQRAFRPPGVRATWQGHRLMAPAVGRFQLPFTGWKSHTPPGDALPSAREIPRQLDVDRIWQSALQFSEAQKKVGRRVRSSGRQNYMRNSAATILEN